MQSFLLETPRNWKLRGILLIYKAEAAKNPLLVLLYQHETSQIFLRLKFPPGMKNETVLK